MLLCVGDMPMTAYRSNAGTLVPLTALRVTQQPILYYDEDKIKRYADLMQKDTEFPPIEVSDDGKGGYTVWQGHHRVQASRRCSFTHIPVVIIPMPSLAQ
jgi:ParB-like chromosome segregation protein Spo0J